MSPLPNPKAGRFNPLRACGCYALLGLVAVAILGVWGYRRLEAVIFQAVPMAVPRVVPVEGEREALERRVAAFRDAVEAGPVDPAAAGETLPAAPELNLSERDLNIALLDIEARREGASLENGKLEDLYVRLEGDGRVRLQVVFWVEGKGYVNVEAVGRFAVDGGEPRVDLESGAVGGEDNVLTRELLQRTLEAPAFREGFRRVESLRVEGDRMRIRVRKEREGAR
ncbi:MAG: hypothetical protein HY722_09090 [Planctomycetes bacterium]|nr:hypothetical protein [Planctomycetota bacterium]